MRPLNSNVAASPVSLEISMSSPGKATQGAAAERDFSKEPTLLIHHQHKPREVKKTTPREEKQIQGSLVLSSKPSFKSALWGSSRLCLPYRVYPAVLFQRGFTRYEHVLGLARSPVSVSVQDFLGPPDFSVPVLSDSCKRVP